MLNDTDVVDPSLGAIKRSTPEETLKENNFIKVKM